MPRSDRLGPEVGVAVSALIRAVAETLRGRAQEANALRTTLAEALVPPKAKTAFDVFGSDLPDEGFAVIFDQPRQSGWRKVDL